MALNPWVYIIFIAVVVLAVLLRRRRHGHKRTAIPTAVKRAVYKRDHGRCRHCGRRDKYLEYDHIKPWSQGGENTVNNIQLLCRACNEKKGDRYTG